MVFRQLPIVSRFVSSIIVLIPYRAGELQQMISQRFTVDEIGGSGFLAIAVVDQAETRPKGIPATVGLRLNLIEYLVFATYTPPSGNAVSGFVLVHSETDSRLACLLGPLVSPYRFSYVDLQRVISPASVSIRSARAQLMIRARRSDPAPNALETIGQLAKARSFNFVSNEDDHSVLINGGILKGWAPSQLELEEVSSGWLSSLPLQRTGPSFAMMVEDVRYLFKRHRIDEVA